MNRSLLYVALLLLLGVSSGFAQEAEPDSVQVVQPTFSMTPT